jgi:hypothetical protein
MSVAETIDGYFATSYGQFEEYEAVGRLIVEEAERIGLDLPLACALVEQESGGRNIFGCDSGNVGDVPPFCHQPVTQRRVLALIDSEWMNGVGLTQLTWYEFVNEAEAMGGAHLPRYQLRVGFRILKEFLDKYPEAEAIACYNAGEANRWDVIDTYDG